MRKPKWDREGVHALLGLFTAGLLWSAETPALVAGAALFFVGFWVYEVVEGWRLRDLAYRGVPI